MIGFGTLAKMAAGGLGPDEIKAVLSGLGINLEMAQVTDARAEFRSLAESASLPSSKLVKLAGTLKNGEKVHALLIVNR